MSQPAPCGRAMPRWSAGSVQSATGMTSMAGLPGSRATVGTASGVRAPSIGSVLGRSVGPDPQVPSSSRVKPREIDESQLATPLLAMMLASTDASMTPIPFSTTVECVTHVQVRVDSSLFELLAVHVTDPAERRPILEYRGYEPVPDGIALFRFDPRD